VTLNRSFLFAPGNVARRVEKAFTLEADAYVLLRVGTHDVLR